MKKQFTLLLLVAMLFGFNQTNLNAQCFQTFAFPAGAVAAPTLPLLPTVITTCSWAGDYSTISGLVTGSLYCVDAPAATSVGYATVSTTITGGAVGSGALPYCFTATAATMYVHWSIDATCATANICDATEIVLQPTPLSVSFGSLSATSLESAIEVAWTTESENNNEYFVIERSIDGQTFRPIGDVQSQADHGNSFTQIDYNFQDQSPKYGENIYRLKQIDIDGKSSYSDLVSATWNKMDAAVSFFPMPFQKSLKAEISLEEASRVSVIIADVSGRTVFNQEIVMTAGTQIVDLDLSHLIDGIYAVQINSQNKVLHRQSIKKLSN